MALTRLRMDELVNAWVGDRDTPFQLGLLATFEPGPFAEAGGGVDARRVAREVSTRAHGIAPLRRRIVWTRPGEGRPVWVDDPDDDPADHVTVTRLDPGTDLPTWAAGRTVMPLARDHPLWRADVVDGLPGGRFGVLVVVHHLLVDGLAGVRLLAALLDDRPDAVRPAPPAPHRRPLPGHRDLVTDRVRSWRDRPRRATPRAGHRRPEPRRALAEYREAMGQLSGPLPDVGLPRRVGPTRRMVVASADVAALRSAGGRLGATVNDLLLAAVTDGLRALLLARGGCDPRLFVRTIIPVATDPSGQAAGMMVVDLPVGEADAGRRLARVVERTTARKRRLRESGGTGNGILDLPVPLARLVVPWARRRGSARIHLSVTNVPGPAHPLWFAGARMVQAVPVAPLVPLVGLTVGALSYDGRLVVGVNADGTLHDLDVLGDGIAASLAGLEAQAP